MIVCIACIIISILLACAAGYFLGADYKELCDEENFEERPEEKD